MKNMNLLMINLACVLLLKFAITHGIKVKSTQILLKRIFMLILEMVDHRLKELLIMERKFMFNKIFLQHLILLMTDMLRFQILELQKCLSDKE
jgi:hypothetical protein